ncbi:MAG TPA: regulatory protein RecX [Vicinamibacterales bacterium]|nr:regulatory protein RecX [Vicinamibacterales bacterium]
MAAASDRSKPSAYLDGLRLLARRERSVEEVRARLLDRDHPREEVEAALAHLLETGALDDARVAREAARTALSVKGRGRLRVERELVARGIARDVVAQAVGDVFGSADERALIARALQKKLRGKRIASTADAARLYQFLLRQGFTPAAVSDALRASRRS